MPLRITFHMEEDVRLDTVAIHDTSRDIQHVRTCTVRRFRPINARGSAPLRLVAERGCRR